MGGSKYSRRFYRQAQLKESASKSERVLAKRARKKRKMERERARRSDKVVAEYGSDAWSACGRKFRYDSRHDAEEHIATHASDVPLYCYRCRYCGGWHLTSHPRQEDLDA